MKWDGDCDAMRCVALRCDAMRWDSCSWIVGGVGWMLRRGRVLVLVRGFNNGVDGKGCGVVLLGLGGM